MIKTIRFQGPFQGVNKAVDSSYLGVLEAEDALNVILDKGTLLKRDGFTPLFTYDGTNDGSISGIFDYVKNDGTLKTLIASGSNLYSTTFANGILSSSSLVPGVLTPGTLVNFQTVNNRVYLANGAVFKVTDNTALFDANLPNPAAPTVTLVIKRAGDVYPGGAELVGTGKLTGLYDYRYTWYSSTWGQESQGSQPSQFLTYQNDNRRLTFRQANGTRVTVPNDARITHARIYRRKTSDGETDWSFVTDLAVTPNAFAPDDFDDTMLDVDVDRFTKAPIGSLAGTVTNFGFMAFQDGVLFLSGSPTFPNRVYYTLPNRPYELQGFLEVGSGGDNEKVTGLASFMGELIVFKTSSIWVWSGNSKETFYVKELIPNVGCRGHFSIVSVDNLLFFLGQKGFYAFDGREVRELSEKIKPDLVSRNQLLDQNCVGVHDFERGMILWSYCGAGSSKPNKMAAYFYRNAREIEDDSWCPWSFQNEQATMLALIADNTTRIQSLVFGMDSGVIGLYGGDHDDDNPIPFLWRTGKQSGGVPEVKKIWDEATIQLRPSPTATLLTLNLYLDNDPAPETVTHDMSDPIFRCRFGRSSSECRWEFTSNVEGKCEIVGWTQRAELAEDA